METSDFCNFIDIGLDQYQCDRCGIIVGSLDGPPALICSIIDPSDISEIQLIGLACNEIQIAERYRICTSCEFFKDYSCTQCGCRVVRNLEFKNKLLWKDHECPVGKWGKEA